MSSLTSPSVNKNTTRFAPKVKQRERRRSSLKTSIPLPTSRSTTPNPLFSTNDFKQFDPVQKKMEVSDTTTLSGLSTAPPSSSAPALDTSPVIVQSKELLTTNSTAITVHSKAQPPPSVNKKRRSSTQQPSTTFSAPTKGAHAVGVTPTEPPPATTVIPSLPTHNNSHSLTESDSGTNQPIRTNRRKRLASVESLVTLDDITHDPATEDLLQKPLYHFMDDLANGIVSKTFKERSTKTSTPTPAPPAPVKDDPPTEPLTLPEPPGLQESQVMIISTAPQLRLVNGEIVLDTSSLYIEAQPRKQVDYEVVEEDSMTKKINSRTHGKQHNSYGKRWNQSETDLFYRGLTQFGTDFEMIASSIPSRTRKEVKHMFNRQEKLNPAKITDFIMQRAST